MSDCDGGGSTLRADRRLSSSWMEASAGDMDHTALVCTAQPQLAPPILGGELDPPLAARPRGSGGTQRRVGGVSVGKNGTKTSAAEKRLARALRNRESARRSRLKSKMRVQSLEVAFSSLKEENCALKNALHQVLPVCMQRSPKLRSQLHALLVELKLLG